MKRSPMKRGSGFKPKLPPKPENPRAGEFDSLPVRKPAASVMRIADGAARLSVPAPKFTYVRSPALLAACRRLACQHCGTNDGTVCAAHSNWGHGKGKSTKASDVFVASLCFTHHSAIDQGSRLTRAQRQELWWNAHVRTVDLLVRMGWWPEGILVPDTTIYPF